MYTGAAEQALEMYTGAGKWAAAHKVAMGYLPEQEVQVSSCPCCAQPSPVQFLTNAMHALSAGSACMAWHAEPAESAELTGSVHFRETHEHLMLRSMTCGLVNVLGSSFLDRTVLCWRAVCEPASSV